ncbi:MAG: hypothetical protein HW404_2206, partial [Anaerolineales bacterium]|nr:hypothetical protein [Anaerolineales bacterium]
MVLPVAGAGPKKYQARNVSAAIARTIGTKTAETRSARRWRQALDGSLGSLRLLDQADDLRQGRVRADAPGFGLQAAEAVERAADDLVVSALLHRHRLPGQHRLIDRRMALQDAPVDRDLLPRLDDENVADAHLLDRDFEFLAVSNDARRFRAQAHQTPDGVARPAARPGLQQLAQDDQGDDDGGGLEVQVAARQTEHDRHGVEVGGRRAHGDQHVHVGGAVAQSLEGAAVVLAAGVELDRRRQAHGARASDDQHGHGVDHGLGQEGVAGGGSRAEEIPGQECQRCDRQDDRDEDRRDAVRQAL